MRFFPNGQGWPFGNRPLRAEITPDEKTIGNFLSVIDPVELQSVLSAWLMKTYNKPFKGVSVDGKALRASNRGFLNVFANELGIVLQQLPTTKGGGEKNQMHELLESDVDLTGKVILADALLTDKDIVEAIQKKTPHMCSQSKIIRST